MAFLIRGFMDKKLSSGCRVWPSKRPGFFCLDIMSGTGFKILQPSKAGLVVPPTRLQGSKSSWGGASSDKTLVGYLGEKIGSGLTVG